MMKAALLYPDNKKISYGFQKLLRETISFLSNADIEVHICVKTSKKILTDQLNNITSDNNLDFIYYLNSQHLRDQINLKNISVILSLDYKFPLIQTDARIINTLQNMEPLIDTYYGSLIDKVMMFLLNKRVKYYVSKADATLCLSKFTQQWVRKNFSFQKTYINYLGADNSSTKTSFLENQYVNDLLQSNKKLLFSAGSIRPARGIEDLICAAHCLSKFRSDFIVAFAGSLTANHNYQKKLNSQINRLGLSDKFLWLGSCNESEMRALYKRSDVFVMTSRVEACPNILLEAMHYKCTIISNKKEPMTELLKNYGQYYTQGDFHQLSYKLNQMLEQLNLCTPRPIDSLNFTLTWDRWGKNILSMLYSESKSFRANPTN